MKSLITKGLLVASLVLTANAAMAANIQTHKHPLAIRHVASRPLPAQPNTDIGQLFQSLFSGGLPMQYAGRSSHRSSGFSSDSPSYDSSPSVDTSSQAASDMQSLNDENALNASTAAAEQQNEAAQAAAIQTEINANN
jgi:hypothetical protein